MFSGRCRLVLEIDRFFFLVVEGLYMSYHSPIVGERQLVISFYDGRIRYSFGFPTFRLAELSIAETSYFGFLLISDG